MHREPLFGLAAVTVSVLAILAVLLTAGLSLAAEAMTKAQEQARDQSDFILPDEYKWRIVVRVAPAWDSAGAVRR